MSHVPDSHRKRLRRKRRDQLVTLRALVELEMSMIESTEPRWQANEYLLGRMGAYKFVAMAIDDRLGPHTAR